MGQRWPRLLCIAALAASAYVESAGAAEAPQDAEAFEAHALLRAAVESLRAGAPTVAASQSPIEEAQRVTAQCVPPALGRAFQSGFQSAVGLMLQKTGRSMQRGLRGLADSITALLDGASCGELAALRKFREQASRLGVLAASSRSLAGLDSKVVNYEPLKALTIGGIDVHTELNALIIAWQLNKGTEEVGKSLAKFLQEFAEEAEDGTEGGAASSVSTASPTPPASSAESLARQAPSFWVTMLNSAWGQLGDTSAPVSDLCLPADTAKEFSQRLDAAFGRMMERSRRGMQAGLKALAKDTLELLDRLEAACAWLAASGGAVRLRSAASRLAVLASAKSLVNYGVHLEYEALKALRIGGIDVHVELNRYIGSWIRNERAAILGVNMADFFADFKEQEEAEEKADSGARAGEPLWIMIKDAILAAQGGMPPLELPSHCFPREVMEQFAKEMDDAIDHMLQKRMRTMQQGLKQMADATDKLITSAPVECVWTTGGQVMKSGAKKVRKLTRKTLVDYGTHIKYEAMKSLKVGGVAVHTELNNFLAAWKLRSQQEAGTPFGQLMLKFASISGHDEL